MSMSRDDAATYLIGALSPLLVEAGLGTADEPGELKEVIDDAFLMAGVAYDDLATAETAGTWGFLRILDYNGLARIYKAVLNRVDVTLEGSQSKKRSQFVANLKASLDVAQAAAEPFVSTVITSSATGMSTGALLIDIIEPEAVA